MNDVAFFGGYDRIERGHPNNPQGGGEHPVVFALPVVDAMAEAIEILRQISVYALVPRMKDIHDCYEPNIESILEFFRLRWRRTSLSCSVR